MTADQIVPIAIAALSGGGIGSLITAFRGSKTFSRQEVIDDGVLAQFSAVWEGRLSDAEGRITVLEGELTAARTDLETARQELMVAEHKLAAAEKNLAAARQEVYQLRIRVVNLEEAYRSLGGDPAEVGPTV